MPALSVTLFSLFFTLSAFAISANAVPPLISTLAGGFGVKAFSFGFFMTLRFVSFAGAVLLRSALSASGSSKNLCLSQVF
jgi:hypothetical protein